MKRSNIASMGPAAEGALRSGAEIRRRPEMDPLTLLCYGAIGIFGFLTNGLGPVLPFLQAELSVRRGEIGTFSLFLAFGLLTVGLLGHWVVRLVGRRAAFWAGVVAMTSGALLLPAASSLLVLGASVALIGAGGAMLVFLVPAILADRHSHLAMRAIVLMTGIVSTTAILAPLLISLSVTMGTGWRIGYIAVPVAAAVVLAVIGWRVQFQGEHLVPAALPSGAHAGHQGGSYWRRWIDVLGVISVEMCMVFWSADYLVSVLRVDAATAAGMLSLFLIGMAVGRVGGGRFSGTGSLFLSAVTVSAVGFAIFWLASTPIVAAIGLLITGLGVALLYPLSISRAIAAWPSDPTRASARAALAVGLAFGIAPYALASIAERTGFRSAFLIVPALLAVVTINAVALGRTPSSERLQAARNERDYGA
jgi:fucose permease